MTIIHGNASQAFHSGSPAPSSSTLDALFSPSPANDVAQGTLLPLDASLGTLSSGQPWRVDAALHHQYGEPAGVLQAALPLLRGGTLTAKESIASLGFLAALVQHGTTDVVVIRPPGGRQDDLLGRFHQSPRPPFAIPLKTADGRLIQAQLTAGRHEAGQTFWPLNVDIQRADGTIASIQTRIHELTLDEKDAPGFINQMDKVIDAGRPGGGERRMAAVCADGARDSGAALAVMHELHRHRDAIATGEGDSLRDPEGCHASNASLMPHARETRGEAFAKGRDTFLNGCFSHLFEVAERRATRSAQPPTEVLIRRSDPAPAPAAAMPTVAPPAAEPARLSTRQPTAAQKRDVQAHPPSARVPAAEAGPPHDPANLIARLNALRAPRSMPAPKADVSALRQRRTPEPPLRLPDVSHLPEPSESVTDAELLDRLNKLKGTPPGAVKTRAGQRDPVRAPGARSGGPGKASTPVQTKAAAALQAAQAMLARHAKLERATEQLRKQYESAMIRSRSLPELSRAAAPAAVRASPGMTRAASDPALAAGSPRRERADAVSREMDQLLLQMIQPPPTGVRKFVGKAMRRPEDLTARIESRLQPFVQAWKADFQRLPEGPQKSRGETSFVVERLQAQARAARDRLSDSQRLALRAEVRRGTGPLAAAERAHAQGLKSLMALPLEQSAERHRARLANHETVDLTLEALRGAFGLQQGKA